MKKLVLLYILVVIAITSNSQTVTDIDGNIYHTVEIGNQEWFVENLKTTRYTNGETMANVVEDSLWGRYSAFYCDYGNDPAKSALYGRLYNWPAVKDERGICPKGWHVPSAQEWEYLVDYLGGASIAGNTLKESGTDHWIGPNTGATNESGFTAMPGGFRNNFGAFHDITITGIWWTTTIGNEIPYPYCYEMWDGSNVTKVTSFDLMGHSVRCLKDSKVGLSTFTEPKELLIYPNPVKEKFSLTMRNDSRSIITIYDLQGNLVLSMQADENPIDISTFSNGIYLVGIRDSKEIIYTKLIKE